MEVSASDFARMCGVSAMAISKKIKAGTLIRNSARKLDTDNVTNREYLESKRSSMKSKLETRELERAVTAAPSPVEESDSGNAALMKPAEIRRRQFSAPEASDVFQKFNESDEKAKRMMDMTLRQLLNTFGNLDSVEKYSKILRDLSAADEREQKTQERRLMQIPKDFVQKNLFGYVNQIMSQLLDMPESVCDQIIALVRTKGDGCRNDIIHVISDNLTKIISGTKEHILNELELLKGRYEKQEATVDQLVGEKLEEMREIG